MSNEKRIKLLSACSALILLGVGMTPSAQAAFVAFDFTATIKYMYEYDASSNTSTFVNSSTTLGAQVSNVDIIHGHFYYDQSMPVLTGYQPAQPAQGTYVAYGGQEGLDFSTGQSGFQFASGANPGALLVANNASSLNGIDDFGFGIYPIDLPGIWQIAILDLSDSSGTVFNSSAIPSALPLDRFSNATLDYSWLIYSSGDQFHFNADIVSLTPSPGATVPEPATYTLLIAGFGLLGFTTRRRKQNI